MNVFTYGTLMFPEVWQAVVGREFGTVEGTVCGFAILRVVDAVYPGMIELVEGAAIHGVVYLDVDRVSVERLDRFEGDCYERRTLQINCTGGQRLTADAYVVLTSKRHILTSEPWARETFEATGGLERFLGRYPGFTRVAGES